MILITGSPLDFRNDFRKIFSGSTCREAGNLPPDDLPVSGTSRRISCNPGKNKSD